MASKGAFEYTEFQAVILAGPGASLGPLSKGISKALLPVAGMPLLSYALQWLDESAIKDILIVSPASAADQLNNYVRTLDGKKPEVAFCEDGLSSMDALRKVKDRLKHNLILMAVDSVPIEPARTLMDLFRVTDATAMALYYPNDATDHWVGFGKLPWTSYAQSSLRHTGSVGRLISSTAMKTMAKNAGLTLSTKMMRLFPSVRMIKALDAHVYLLRGGVIDKLLEQKASSFQLDCLPALIKAQYLPHSPLANVSQHSRSPTGDSEADFNNDEDDDEDSASGMRRDKAPLVLGYAAQPVKSAAIESARTPVGSSQASLIASLQNLSVSDASSPTSSGSRLQLLRQSGYPGGRANTVAAYTELNRTMAKILPQRLADSATVAPNSVGPESMVGEHTVIGERSSVKKTSIGAKCVIGKNVKLANCVIFDNVTIENDTKLESAIVCSNSKIEERCNLKDTIVAANTVVRRESTEIHSNFLELEPTQGTRISRHEHPENGKCAQRCNERWQASH